MKDQLTALAMQIATMLVPVIAALVVAFISKGIAALSAKMKSDVLAQLLHQMELAADAAVKAAQQTVLDKLRLIPGATPPEKLLEAKAHAMSSMKAQLGPKSLTQIKSTLGLHSDRDLETLLSTKIEAKVREKNASLETANTPIGGTP